MKKSIIAVILIICLVSGTVLGSKNYKVSAAGGPEEGLVIIASVQDPSFCIDVDNYGTKNGTKVQLWKTKTGKPADVANQYYYLEKNSDGTYSFRLAYTENVYLHAATEKQIATIVHAWEGKGINGRYNLIKVAGTDDEYYIQNCGNSGYLDVYEGKMENGNYIITYPFNGGLNQRFKLIRVNLNSAPLGYLDTAEYVDGKLHVTGWTFSWDDSSKAITAAVRVDSKWYTFTADKYRPDVNKVYSAGSYHGFDEWITVEGSGKQEIIACGVKPGTSDGYLLNGSYKMVDIQPRTTTHYWYTVNTPSGVNVRSGAGTSYKKLCAIKNKTTVEVLSINNGWAKIKYGSTIGYVCADYLKYSHETKEGSGNSSLNSETKYYPYNGVNFIVVKNLSPEMGQKQKPSQCTKTSADIVVSLALGHGRIYKDCGWVSGKGCTWRDITGKIILQKGYASASAKEKMNVTAKLIKDYGAAVIMRLGNSSASVGHSIVAVGIREGYDPNNVTYNDILIIDPADGKIKCLAELQNSSYWHNGVQSYNDWSLLYSITYPTIDGFTAK